MRPALHPGTLLLPPGLHHMTPRGRSVLYPAYTQPTPNLHSTYTLTESGGGEPECPPRSSGTLCKPIRAAKLAQRGRTREADFRRCRRKPILNLHPTYTHSIGTSAYRPTPLSLASRARALKKLDDCWLFWASHQRDFRSRSRPVKACCGLLAADLRRPDKASNLLHSWPPAACLRSVT